MNGMKSLVRYLLFILSIAESREPAYLTSPGMSLLAYAFSSQPLRSPRS